MPYLGLVALLIVLAATVRWFWRMWRVNIPKTPYLFQSIWGGGFVLGIVALYQGSGGSAAGWAVGVAVLLLYLSSTGAQKVTGEMVNVGDSLPAFTAPDDSGETFDSASLVGAKVLLKFFRGHW